MRLTVTKTIAIAELGTVVFLEIDPGSLAPGSRHRCLVTCPGADPLEAVASVETVRAESSGLEFPALLFSTLSVRQVVPGASISILEAE